MPQLSGFKELQIKLKGLATKAKRESSKDVIVGYTANYALYVHENLQAHHTNGQAKYLEQPARELKDQLGNIAAKAMKNGAPMDKALFLAGLRLQRDSQQLVPVDTGNLKASAFTRFD